MLTSRIVINALRTWRDERTRTGPLVSSAETLPPELLVLIYGGNDLLATAD